jgi:hypothetical protein
MGANRRRGFFKGLHHNLDFASSQFAFWKLKNRRKATKNE